MKSVQPNKAPRERREALLEEKRASSCTSPSRCSVSFHPDVWRFVAACVESWAAMSRILDKTAKPEPDAHQFALNMADWTADEIRKAAGKPNAPNQARSEAE